MSSTKQNFPVFSSQYFGGIEFYSGLFHLGYCFIEQNEHYQKRTFRNRLYILSPQGVAVLSVPLMKGKNAQLPMRAVQISYDENWPKNHMQALQSYYGKSPFFEYYVDGIRDILFARHSFLWDLNQALCSYVCSCLSIEAKIQYTDVYHTDYTYDFRDSNSDNYVQMRSRTLDGLRYNQVFEDKKGFIPNLSILDLLFCCGPESIFHLNRQVFSF